MVGIGVRQFQRTYPGGYKINFPLCLSGSNDFKVKNYTNFYLSNEFKFSDVFDVESDRLRATKIFTTIQYGEDYLSFGIVDSYPYSEAGRYADHFNYGTCRFTSTSGTDTFFTIEIKDDNICNIFYLKDYKKYYLVTDTNNKVAFAKEKLLSFSPDTINPQDFKYLFSEDQKALQLFKKTPSGDYFVTKDGDTLKMFELADDNVVSYIAKSPFKIQRNIYTEPNVSLNQSFVTYNNENTINYDDSVFGLKNNFLIHKKYLENPSLIDIIPLKNQLLQNDVFSTGNNLLSSTDPDNHLFVDGFREYTSINQDIKEENTEELELNYVFYNKTYKINSGSTEFHTPSSMYPFNSLNVNDTKFIESGAFSFDSPLYADRIYSLSQDNNLYDNNQHLLCTWLSGNPTSKDKVWVDRYYYPDRIEKIDALTGKTAFNGTYDSYIEQLILNNSNIRKSIDESKFFDKLSDLAFEPNKKYRYERVKITDIPSLSSNINLCNDFSEEYPVNYFKKINISNKFTFGIYFNGNSESWKIESDTNAIKCGLFIEKNADVVKISYNLFDSSDESFLLFEKEIPFKKLKENFLSVSVDAINGLGYFFLNNDIVLEFKVPVYQYVKKQLLYGDFFIIKDIKVNLLAYNGSDVYDPFISDNYTDQSLAFTLPILNGKMKVDTLYITLPCGMRNSIDNVEYLQSICGSAAFKSNSINLNIKNLNISNENILNGIRSSIESTLNTVLPVNSKINKVEFTNYK